MMLFLKICSVKRSSAEACPSSPYAGFTLIRFKRV